MLTIILISVILALFVFIFRFLIRKKTAAEKIEKVSEEAANMDMQFRYGNRKLKYTVLVYEEESNK